MKYPGVAVGVIVLKYPGTVPARMKDIRVLLGKRKGPLGTGQYSLPGGKVDFGEPPIHAAAREVEEETGLRVSNLTFTGKVSNDWFPVQGKHFINLFYTAIAENPEDLHVPDSEKDKFDEWLWYSPYKLPKGVWMHSAEAILTVFDPWLKRVSRLPGIDIE